MRNGYAITHFALFLTTDAILKRIETAIRHSPEFDDVAPLNHGRDFKADGNTGEPSMKLDASSMVDLNHGRDFKADGNRTILLYSSISFPTKLNHGRDFKADGNNDYKDLILHQ